MPLTIDIMNAIKIVNLDPIVVENLNKLIDIRDTAVHFYQSDVLSYLLYTLGVASLRNYQKLIASWFSKSLLDYNFYILPLGFVYNFKTLSMLELEKGPEIVANLIKSVTETQASVKSSGDFDFVCEVSIEMKTAKHFVAGADLTAAIDQTAKDAVIVHRVVNLVDKYPLSYTELCAKVKKELSSAKQNAINRLIREHDIKKNPSMSHYVYKSKTQEEEYKKTGILPKGTPSIYNEDAVRYIVATLSTN